MKEYPIDPNYPYGANIFALCVSVTNDAFQNGNREVEIARILREVAERLEEGYTSIPMICDSNGNNIGGAHFTSGCVKD